MNRGHYGASKWDDCGDLRKIDDNPNPKKYCDLDYDWHVHINDWKIEAMRIIAQGGFDKSYANYNRDDGGKDTDDDEYEANLGGDDKTRGKKYCYLHDFKNGIDYELNSMRNEFFCNPGSGEIEVGREDIACVRNKRLICTDNEYRLCKITQDRPRCQSNGEVRCSDGRLARCILNENVIFPGNEYDCDENLPPSTEDIYRCGNENVLGPAIYPRCDYHVEVNGCRHLFPCF